ncbi:MAG: cell division protein FtsW [Proteobacteria bacterium]|nr:cell division protein FtsW [Pseudomonadota bacterium]
MISFARSDQSLLSRWWWTVDRWLILALLTLVSIGLLLTFAASPAVAERLGLSSFHFAQRQFVFLVASVGVMFLLSLVHKKTVRRLAALMFPLFLGLLYATIFFGPEIKGATRWMQFGSFTLQPSEFLKPAFVVITGWMLSEQLKTPTFPGRKIVLGVFAVVLFGLFLQPDFGQMALISIVFAAQLVAGGLPLLWVVALGGAGIGSLVLGYFQVPHIQGRIDAFLNPESADTYQIDAALNAFRSGGLFGLGPGEGTVKKILPDAHTDFIFAVAGEEFGILACLGILLLFTVIVVRGLAHLLEQEDQFVVLAAGGLIILFGLQALINIGVNLAVIPAKGMTLPFISYGGSSALALAITMGMVLALTRRNRHLKTKTIKRGGF